MRIYRKDRPPKDGRHGSSLSFGLMNTTRDVYVSDDVSRNMHYDPEFKAFVADCLDRYRSYDFGDISYYTLNANMDMLITPGSGPYYACYTYYRGNPVRYPKGYMRIKIRTLRYFTYICQETEHDPGFFDKPKNGKTKGEKYNEKE